jgi:integrase
MAKGRRQNRGRRAHGEGTIFYRADRQRWMVRLPGASSVRSFKTEKDATDYLITARQQQRDGTLVHPSALTVAEWLQEWLTTRTVRLKLSFSSVVRYERSIKRIKPIIGTVRLRDLQSRHVEHLIAKMEANQEPHATVRMVFEDLRNAMRAARKAKLISAAVMEDVEPPKPIDNSGVMRSLTDEEARAFMAAADQDEELGAFYKLALTTGLRRGEMLALQWTAVDLQGGTMAIDAGVVMTRGEKRRLGWRVGPLKTASSRRQVALTPEVIDALRAHQRRQKELYLRTGRPWNASTFIFQSSDGGFLTPPALQYRHRLFIKKHKLAPHRFHDLRHSTATLLLKHGESIAVVSQLLGHSNPTMTLKRYAHVLPDQRKAVAARMSKLLAG